MIQYDSSTQTCTFTPHKALTEEPWHQIVQRHNVTNPDLYVLQCSSSRTNLILNNDLSQGGDEYWQVVSFVS